MKSSGFTLFNGKTAATTEYVDDALNFPSGRSQLPWGSDGKIDKSVIPHDYTNTLRITDVEFDTTDCTAVSGGGYQLTNPGYCIYVYDGNAAVPFEIEYSAASSTITFESLTTGTAYHAYFCESEESTITDTLQLASEIAAAVIAAKDATIVASSTAVAAKDAAVAAKTTAETAVTACQTLNSQSQAIYDGLVAINTFNVGHAYNFGITVSGTQVSICWADPNNFVTQEMATVAIWQKTRLIYKTGGFPANENDGTVLVDNTVRDQYRETPFVYDMGVVSNYYFALFSCTTGGVWNVSDTAPRFTTDDITWSTIAMMTRTNTLLQYPGMAIGTVVDIQTNSDYPRLRWKLAHVNYQSHYGQVSDFHYDHAKQYNSIWIPNYLPCNGSGNTAHQFAFDAPESSYAQTWDTEFITDKTYYKIVDTQYVAMTAGTDYENGSSISEWSTTNDATVFTKNHAHRVSYGHNSWKESNMRLWLNSSGSSWFTQQNEYDRKGGPTTGWLSGFDSGFLSLIMPVYNLTARNTISSLSGGGGGGCDITLDRFWLPSIKEVFNSNNGSFSEGGQFDYFLNVATTASSRIQRDEGGTARYTWLRSPYSGYTYLECNVDTSGSSYNISNANYSYAFLPAMCIA